MAMDHVSIEMARANGIHLLCWPACCTHVLQPLDIDLFKSYFSKACTTYLACNPGHVVTPGKLALLVADAWQKPLLHSIFVTVPMKRALNAAIVNLL